MYQTHWGLEKPPFSSRSDTRLFYKGANQRESLARLRFLLAHRRRLGLVMGDSGLGKSSLHDRFADQCQKAGHAVAQVCMTGLSSREFYWQLGNALQAAVRVEDDLVRLFRQVTDRLYENGLQGQQTLVLLDDLDQAGPDLLSQVLRLTRTETTGLLTFVGSVRPTKAGRLGQSLLDRVDLRIDLEPWDELDTIGYLQSALLEAGADRPLFDDEAMTALHRLSDGVPRSVNRLADFALLAGSDRGQEVVDAATVEAAAEAVSLPNLVS